MRVPEIFVGQPSLFEFEPQETAKVFVLDTETSGFETYSEILQITIVGIDGEIAYSSFVKPIVPIDERGSAYAVNRISNKMVENAPNFRVCHPEVLQILQGNIAIAYNAAFDSRMLRQDCERHKLEVPRMEWRCAMNTAARRFGRRCKLEEACQRFGIDHSQAHEATKDALDTLLLCKALGMVK